MKKTFIAPTASLMSVEMESSILTASTIVAGGTAKSGAAGAAGNGGDANARKGGQTAVKVNANISAYELN